MLLARKIVAVFLSLVVSYGLAFGGLKEDAEAISVSGGEDHTLILTANRWAKHWGYGRLPIPDVEDVGGAGRSGFPGHR